MMKILSMFFILIIMSKLHFIYRQILTGAIEKFVGKLTGARTASSHLGLLFNLLTLYHFLKKVSEPFGYLEQDPKQITWHLSTSGSIFSKLDLLLEILSQQLASNNYSLCLYLHHYRALVKLYSGLEPLFNINPLLLPVFVCMCPFSGYPGLFQVLPPFYSMARLAYLSDQSSNVPNVSSVNLNVAFHVNSIGTRHTKPFECNILSITKRNYVCFIVITSYSFSIYL